MENVLSLRILIFDTNLEGWSTYACMRISQNNIHCV